ncbi:hypothetical protein X975_22723, partial [Stegodyphus mimosarum]
MLNAGFRDDSNAKLGKKNTYTIQQSVQLSFSFPVFEKLMDRELLQR